MTNEDLKTLVAQARTVYKQTDDPANMPRQLLSDLIVALLSLSIQVPCANCNGNGYILGLTDTPRNAPDRKCGICDGTGKKYNI